nr:MAG TPA: minor tail protein [Caudoviricetes sp.]
MHRRRDGIVAKNKVINTVLTLKDEMSGGLVAAAKAAKKSGKNIDDSMMQATRKVVAFKNKSLTALGDFAKKGVKAAGAAVAGMTAAFIALDGATEEYRVAQGKLNAGFQAAGFSTDVARKSYRNFYAILGDTDTATEASQLLANMAKNAEDVTKWTRIAAGVHGTFGDSLPIEGLVESANETARTGQVTGVFADALNWVGIMEDDFNAKLEKTTDVSKRNQLIMDTLSKTYDKAADSFYANNQQVINARRNHATLDEMLAKVGDTSSKLKSQLWVLAGAAEDGSIRSGSALDWVQKKADALTDWLSNLDLSNLKKQFDEKFAQTLQKAGDAVQWCRDNSDTLIATLKVLAGMWAVKKVLDFNSGLTNSISTIGGAVTTLLTMTGVLGGQAAATGTATVAQTGLNAAMAANPIGAVILAIEALIAVGVLLYKNWDTIKAGAQSLWNKFKDVSIRIGTAFSGAFNKVKNAAKTALEWVGDKLSWLNNKIESIPILGSLYKGAKGALGTAIEWVDNATTGNRSGTSTTGTTQTKTNSKTTTTAGPVKTTTSTTTTIPKPTPSSLLSLPGLGKATGTPYWRGGYTRVNERGGEIMNLPSGTQIIPHDVSVKAAGGRSVTVNVTIQGNVIGNREYTEQVGAYVGRKVLAALGNT